MSRDEAGALDLLYRKASAAIAAAESGHVDVEARGTCQACLGAYVCKPTTASQGKTVMVKHGYERPGYGYLVGECRGVGHPPFQLSCEVTKIWRREMIEVVLPMMEKNLADLKSGKIKKFTFVVGGGWVGRKHVDKKIWLTEGETPYEGWTASHPPDFASARKRAILQVEDEIRFLKKDIEWITERIKGWKYDPQALQPKTKPLTEGQGARHWFESSAAELKKLPSPKGDGKTFLDWAHAFPSTLAWTRMGGGRNPSYYKAVRAAYEKATGAAPLAVERAPRVSEVVSREEAERRAAREAKLAERESKAKGKTDRASQMLEKAVSDIPPLVKALRDVVQNPQVVEALKKEPFVSPYGGDLSGRSVYDHLFDWTKREGHLPLIEGTESVEARIEGVAKKTTRGYSSDPYPMRLRRDLRENYAEWRKEAQKHTGLKFKAL